MGLRTTVDVEGGRPVVRQVAPAEDREAVDRLTAKAARLHAAAGDGVVVVVRSRPGELVTEHAGLPLDADRLGSPGALADAVRQVARALDGLHGRGLAHGALRAEHVLVGRGGAVRLCGLALGAADAADDLRQLGELIAGLVDDGAPPTLGALADALQDPEASRRPSARRVAAALAPTSPAAPAGRAGRPLAHRARGRVAIGLALVAVLVVVLTRRGTGGPAGSEGPLPTSTAATATTSAPAPCVASAGRPIDAATCGAAASVDGAAVTVDGHRAVVGRAGDEVLVADWGCEGELRPAVLRPSTGEVLVLGPVAEGGGPGVVRAERVDGATALRAGLDAAGCAALFAVTGDGAIRVT